MDEPYISEGFHHMDRLQQTVHLRKDYIVLPYIENNLCRELQALLPLDRLSDMSTSFIDWRQKNILAWL